MVDCLCTSAVCQCKRQHLEFCTQVCYIALSSAPISPLKDVSSAYAFCLFRVVCNPSSFQPFCPFCFSLLHLAYIQMLAYLRRSLYAVLLILPVLVPAVPVLPVPPVRSSSG